IPSFYLARLTRQHVTVALNGDGGDEAFAGYGWHLANRLAETWRAIPAPVRSAAEAALRAAIPSSGGRRSLRSRGDPFLPALAADRPRRYERWLGVFTGDLKQELIRAEWPTNATGAQLEKLFEDLTDLDSVDTFLAADCRWYLPTDLLVKMDIATMANSLEAR